MTLLHLWLWTAAAVSLKGTAPCDSAAIEVRFASGSATLPREDRKVLKAVSAIVRARESSHRPANLVITAGTDRTGVDRLNYELAKRRGLAVSQYLKRQGVTDENVTIVVPHPGSWLAVVTEDGVPEAANRRALLELNPNCRTAR